MQRGGTNVRIKRKEGAAMMAGAVAMERVASDEESARWLRRGGLVKLRHHGDGLMFMRREKSGDESDGRCVGVRQRPSR